MIRIKDDFFREEEIVMATFNKSEGQIMFFMKNGTGVAYGKEYKVGVIPRQRVLTDAEFEKVKDYFSIDLQAKTIV